MKERQLTFVFGETKNNLGGLSSPKAVADIEKNILQEKNGLFYYRPLLASLLLQL